MGNNEYIVVATRISDNLGGNDLDANGGAKNPTISKPKIKKPRGAPGWFRTFETKINERLDSIETRLTNVETRLDAFDVIVKLNNLKTE